MAAGPMSRATVVPWRRRPDRRARPPDGLDGNRTSGSSTAAQHRRSVLEAIGQMNDAAPGAGSAVGSRLDGVKGFASDNYAGAHPEVLAAVAAASDEHAVSYGADPWT